MFKSKIIAILTIIFLLITLCITVNASDDIPTMSLNDLVIDDDETAATEANSIVANEIATNEIAMNEIIANEIIANEIAANSVVQPPVDIDDEYDPGEKELPQTGVTDDITVAFFVIVCTISAIYAYKKIREYSI